MATIPNFITTAEYLRLERLSEEKHEYLNGVMYAMAGASRAHRQIMNNLLAFLMRKTDGGECEADNSETRIWIPATNRYTYADVVMTCGKQEFQDDELDTLLNPTLIAEVLSHSTEAYDRGAKFQAYQSIPSFEEYLLISQEQMLVEHYARNTQSVWMYRTYTQDETLSLVQAGIQLPLTEIYRGVVGLR